MLDLRIVSVLEHFYNLLLFMWHTKIYTDYVIYWRILLFFDCNFLYLFMHIIIKNFA